MATCTKPSGKKFSEPGYVAKMIRQKLIWMGEEWSRIRGWSTLGEVKDFDPTILAGRLPIAVGPEISSWTGWEIILLDLRISESA